MTVAAVMTWALTGVLVAAAGVAELVTRRRRRRRMPPLSRRTLQRLEDQWP